MKTNELVCDKCNKKFSGQKVDAEKIFICGLCSGLDIAGDPTFSAPSKNMNFTLDERNLLVDALNAYVSLLTSKRPLMDKYDREVRDQCLCLVNRLYERKEND